MPKRIADKLSALLNIPVKEIKSVDYASVNLSDDAVKLLNKIFKSIGDLREGYHPPIFHGLSSEHWCNSRKALKYYYRNLGILTVPECLVR